MRVHLRVHEHPRGEPELVLLDANDEATATPAAAAVYFAGPTDAATAIFPLAPIGVLERTGPSSFALRT